MRKKLIRGKMYNVWDNSYAHIMQQDGRAIMRSEQGGYLTNRNPWILVAYTRSKKGFFITSYNDPMTDKKEEVPLSVILYNPRTNQLAYTLPQFLTKVEERREE